MKEHGECVLCVGALGDLGFSGSDDKTFIQWDLKSGRAVHVYRGHLDAVHCLSISQDGGVFTGSFDHSVRKWDFDAVVQRVAQEEKIRANLEEEKAKEAAEKKAAKKKKKKGSSGKKKGVKKKKK